MHHRNQAAWWVGAAVLAVLGLAVRTALPSIGFTAVLLWMGGGLCLCFGLLQLLKKRRPRLGLWLNRGLWCMIAAGLALGAVTGGIIYRASLGSPREESSCIVVLGAGVNGTVPSRSLRERLDAAFDYLNAHPDARCVVSGSQGRGEDISEAACMFRELTARGIAPERILQEDQADNTRENIRFSLDLAEKTWGSRPEYIGIVSSEYHLYRAGRFAREEGIASFGIPAHTGITALRLNYYLREIAAVWYYEILGG